MNVLLWHKDMPPGHCGISALEYSDCFAFLKHRRPAVCYLNLEGLEKMCFPVL